MSKVKVRITSELAENIARQICDIDDSQDHHEVSHDTRAKWYQIMRDYDKDGRLTLPRKLFDRVWHELIRGYVERILEMDMFFNRWKLSGDDIHPYRRGRA